MSYAPVPSASPDGELKYEGQEHPAKPVGIGTYYHMMADVAARHSSGPSAVPSAAQPCVSPRDGPPLPFANRAGCKRAEIVLDAHGSCEQAGPVGWGETLTLAKK